MSNTSTKPTAFVLVPGAFCPGYYFHKVTEILESKGYPVRQIDLPTVGERKDYPPASVADDAAHVRYHALELLKAGHNIVLVGNSYGGFITTEAAKGLSKPSRNAGPDEGEIIHLVYLASLLAPIGINCQELLAPDNPPVDTASTASYTPALPAEVAGAVLFSDLRVDEQLRYGAMQKPTSSLAMIGRLTYAAYEEYATTVVVTMRDKALSPEFQLGKFEEVEKSGVCNRGLRKVEMDGDHCCMVSRAEELAELLAEIGQGRV